jgi:hypothetical protein
MLVLITGKAESGKDTIGEYLKRCYGFKVDSLAAPIKRLVQDVFVLPKEVVYDRVLREQPLEDPWGGFTVRSLLQRIGTEMFRGSISPDIWVLSLWSRIKQEPNTDWAVTDVRFPNEKDVLATRYDGNILTVKVVRPGREGKTEGGIQGHESESYDIPADYVVKNNGSFDELYAQVDKIMEENGITSFSRQQSDLAVVKWLKSFPLLWSLLIRAHNKATSSKTV